MEIYQSCVYLNKPPVVIKGKVMFRLVNGEVPSFVRKKKITDLVLDSSPRGTSIPFSFSAKATKNQKDTQERRIALS